MNIFYLSQFWALYLQLFLNNTPINGNDPKPLKLWAFSFNATTQFKKMIILFGHYNHNYPSRVNCSDATKQTTQRKEYTRKFKKMFPKRRPWETRPEDRRPSDLKGRRAAFLNPVLWWRDPGSLTKLIIEYGRYFSPKISEHLRLCNYCCVDVK